MNGESEQDGILFLHGAGVTGAWWHPQVAALAGRYHVEAPDLPGHGRLASEPFSLDSAADRVLECIRGRFARPPVLVGISLGGYLAMETARRSPGDTRALVLTGSSMDLGGRSGLGFRLTYLFLRWKGAGWLEEGTLRGYQKRIPPERLAPVLKSGLFLEPAVQAFRQLAGRRFHKPLHSYPNPVLILNGAGDEPNVRHQEKMLAHLQNGALTVIENAGHLTNLEQPDRYTRELERFMLALPRVSRETQTNRLSSRSSSVGAAG